MYTPEFSVENSASQGGYYAGFTPGTTGYPGIDDFDDLTKNFGDPTEGLLSDILTYINTGTYAVHKSVTQSLNSKSRAFAFNPLIPKKAILNKHKFIGMIGTKKMKLEHAEEKVGSWQLPLADIFSI